MMVFRQCGGEPAPLISQGFSTGLVHVRRRWTNLSVYGKIWMRLALVTQMSSNLFANECQLR